MGTELQVWSLLTCLAESKVLKNEGMIKVRMLPSTLDDKCRENEAMTVTYYTNTRNATVNGPAVVLEPFFKSLKIVEKQCVTLLDSDGTTVLPLPQGASKVQDWYSISPYSAYLQEHGTKGEDSAGSGDVGPPWFTPPEPEYLSAVNGIAKAGVDSLANWPHWAKKFSDPMRQELGSDEDTVPQSRGAASSRGRRADTRRQAIPNGNQA